MTLIRERPSGELAFAAVTRCFSQNDQPRNPLPSLLPSLLALLIGIAGWYYIFYSRAAHHLGPVEGDAANRHRILLRRTNGVALVLLAALLYIGADGIDAQRHPRLFVLAWFGVFVLLLAIVVLALIDIRLTISLRGKRQAPPRQNIE